VADDRVIGIDHTTLQPLLGLAQPAAEEKKLQGDAAGDHQKQDDKQSDERNGEKSQRSRNQHGKPEHGSP
jgi:hypothetical protein